jgi:hypothetical protein
MPRSVVGIFIPFALGIGGLGCTTTYYHPTKSSQESNQDLLYCQGVANSLMGSRTVVGTQNQVNMTALGWDIEKRRYVDQCLRAEGWTTEKPVTSYTSPAPSARTTTAPSNVRYPTPEEARRCLETATTSNELADCENGVWSGIPRDEKWPPPRDPNNRGNLTWTCAEVADRLLWLGYQVYAEEIDEGRQEARHEPAAIREPADRQGHHERQGREGRQADQEAPGQGREAGHPGIQRIDKALKRIADIKNLSKLEKDKETAKKFVDKARDEKVRAKAVIESQAKKESKGV